MDKHPSTPSKKAGHLRFVDDSLAFADCCHCSQIFVDEFFKLGAAFDKRHNIFVSDLRLLSGNGRDRRQGAFHIAVHERRAVTDCENIFMNRAANHQIFFNPNATVTSTFAAAIFHHVDSSDTRRPNNSRCRNFHAVFEFENMTVIIDDLSIEHDLDAFFLQDFDGMFLQIFRDHRQKARRRLN